MSLSKETETEFYDAFKFRISGVIWVSTAEK